MAFLTGASLLIVLASAWAEMPPPPPPPEPHNYVCYSTCVGLARALINPQIDLASKPGHDDQDMPQACYHLCLQGKPFDELHSVTKKFSQHHQTSCEERTRATLQDLKFGEAAATQAGKWCADLTGVENITEWDIAWMNLVVLYAASNPTSLNGGSEASKPQGSLELDKLVPASACSKRIYILYQVILKRKPTIDDLQADLKQVAHLADEAKCDHALIQLTKIIKSKYEYKHAYAMKAFTYVHHATPTAGLLEEIHTIAKMVDTEEEILKKVIRMKTIQDPDTKSLNTTTWSIVKPGDEGKVPETDGPKQTTPPTTSTERVRKDSSCPPTAEITIKLSSKICPPWSEGWQACESAIEVNGINAMPPTSKGVESGHACITMDFKTGKILEKTSWDTYSDPQSPVKMRRWLKALQEETVVACVVRGYGSAYPVTYLRELGADSAERTFGSPYVFLGFKSTRTAVVKYGYLPWMVSQEAAYSTPDVTVTRSIKLNQYMCDLEKPPSVCDRSLLPNAINYPPCFYKFCHKRDISSCTCDCVPCPTSASGKMTHFDRTSMTCKEDIL